jgi:hypothetical protein
MPVQGSDFVQKLNLYSEQQRKIGKPEQNTAQPG